MEPTSSSSSKKQAPWSGRDFFVAVGENEHCNWDDMRRYGFVSAGHGEKYRQAMGNLFVGPRVWANIPSAWASAGARGYVGVGEVISPAVRVTEFEVERNGATVPILEAPLSRTC